jgi:hypothetical protein
MGRHAIVAVLSIVAACARPTSTTEPPIRGDDAAIPTATPSTMAMPTVSASSSTTAIAAENAADVHCTKDDDCDWDDPCMAKRCLGGPRKPIACEESSPRPGTCTCIADRCTLRRKTPAPPTTGCKVDRDCGFVASLGICKPGVPPTDRIDEQGTFCRCDGGACAVEVVDAVPCKKPQDCSWLDDPRRPAPASKVPRPFPPVTPCKNGESDSICAASGHCRIVHWKC